MHKSTPADLGGGAVHVQDLEFGKNTQMTLSGRRSDLILQHALGQGGGVHGEADDKADLLLIGELV